MAKGNNFINRFKEDHHKINIYTKSLQKVVRSSQISKARDILNKMEGLIGPHFKFEEDYLYPRLQRLIREIVQKLYNDKEVALQNIKDTKELLNKGELSTREKRNIMKNLARFSITLKRCDNLAYFAYKFDKEEKNELNERYRELKTRIYATNVL